MKLTTVDELIRFNDILDRCGGSVCLQGPDGRVLDLRDGASRLQGLTALSGKDAESYDLYARRREDEALLLSYLIRQSEKTA